MFCLKQQCFCSYTSQHTLWNLSFPIWGFLPKLASATLWLQLWASESAMATCKTTHSDSMPSTLLEGSEKLLKVGEDHPDIFLSSIFPTNTVCFISTNLTILSGTLPCLLIHPTTSRWSVDSSILLFNTFFQNICLQNGSSPCFYESSVSGYSIMVKGFECPKDPRGCVVKSETELWFVTQQKQ